MIEPASIPGLTQDCLIQQSRTCPGCFIETKDVSNGEPSINLKMADMNRDYSSCPISDINMQCMSTSETSYGEQLLSDQLLSFPVPKTQLLEKKDTEKADLDDSASKILYEGLLLDKCNGEDGLLTNPNQDWGYFESFISESKMELLDLCSKNELSVNLFSEEDVDNYMFDDDDDSTLSSDVCSLKIRYESFQDNMREKTNVLQEETQFNFFPSVLVSCTKKDSGVVKRVDELPLKPEEIGFQNGSKGDGSDSSIEQTPDYSPKVNYFIDSSNSADDSGEYSDDSSSTVSSFDTFQDNRPRNSSSQKNAGCSNHLNYGLRAKRKVRYSDDYLYYVDSIEGEKNMEKRDKPPIGPKQEVDDDWRPKKRRKCSRKDPPVIIKYIIVNRFKGEKCMAVKLSRIDSAEETISLNEDTISKYEKLAPLKDFWQEKEREREEQLKLAAGDKLNSHHHAFSSSPPKRRSKLANRLRIQRIQTVEQSPNTQGLFASDPRQEVASTDETSSIGRPLTIATSCACTLDPNYIIHTGALKSRYQEREGRIGNKIFRIKKFRSEARIRSKKMRDLPENSGSMTDLTEVCTLQKNTDAVGGAEDKKGSAAAHCPHLRENQTANTAEKFAFVSTACSPNKGASSENVATSVPVIPGGYLQTLLDASDSSGGSTGISFFPQQSHTQLDLSLEKRQFASVQLAQSCVLSPPSESESPQNCPNLAQMWHPQLGSNQQFAAADIAESAIQHNSFTGEMAMPMAESLTLSGYNQMSLESNRMLYENNYLPEQPLPPDAEFQACQGQPQFQRATLHTDNGRLISFDSVGSLSATSSNYSSLSLKSCEKDGEEDVNENFLAHCSPKLVIQQSIDAITPLRESTDLLDISNFTPDKFRHTSFSELSPPETPNLSPQVMAHEMKIAVKANDLQKGAKMSCTKDVNWGCNMKEQHDLAGYSVDGHEYQLQVFNSGDNLSLDKKEANQADFDAKGTKSKKKNSNKQTAGQCTKKSKAPRAPKAEKGKVPRQTSRVSKKFKALLDEKGGKGQAEGATQPLKDSGSEEWTGSQVHDEQREFEEPSNILSNIVSGMAEVQRFMMASVEPIWGPAANMCLPSEANSLNLKTLKILAGTSSDSKKKGTGASGGTKSRKGGTKRGKNQAKFNTSLPFFPQLALGCNMFDKPNLGAPGINGPAHKKMYRHKTSAKFPRIENLKGKQPEQDPNKDKSLMASFEKLR
ncbi:neurite extension and migration factor-like [Myxocyprinus asiaticus]|uniref:neurite extension and migration factor-like n=1 Tax=Myxocyprinus asiaticus TaxID=70543 RepID=UPI0022230A03|nr:neurite extension and migration factor-like [Myxocyprinus asiaticus]